ncbi:MAG: hypothetical protein OXG96_13550 [Acidobacteria bacterium]|nr:hypothetical protein [Acidobacteriota bacterium]
MNEFEIASLATRILIGAGQVGVVLYAISRMMRANDSRAELQRELMERQERESERRHTETMAALRDQGQAFRDQGQAFRDQGQALQALIQGMQAAIERTAARGTA